MKLLSVYNWRILIFKSNLPPNAKYIGCHLSTYMNEQGDNCFPSIARICSETGLSKPTTIKYIRVLNHEGWLLTKKKGFNGQAWAHNQYYPNIPKNVMEDINEKAVKEIYHLSEGGKTESRRRLNSEHKAVKEVNPSGIDNSIDNYTPPLDGIGGVNKEIDLTRTTRLKHPIPDDFYPSQETAEYAKARQLPDPTQQVLIDNFINTNQSSNWKSANWQSEFRKYLQRTKQKSFLGSHNAKKSTAQLHADENASAFE